MDITEKLKFKLVKFNSAEQKQTIVLRDEILRKPLGLVFTSAQLATEKDDFHVAGYYEDRLAACAVLHPSEDKKLKMRQVAVYESFQRRGIGQKLIKETERVAIENGFDLMYCHARKTAVPFYEKLGYKTVGDEFEEVGIAHFKMEKKL